MKEKFKKWERIRAKGIWHFIIKYGVLLWGLGTAFLFSLVVSLMQWEASFLSILKESLMLFPLGGIGWGTIMWFANENSYKKHVSSRFNSDFRSLGNGMRILLSLILGLNLFVTNTFAIDEKSKSGAEEIKELVLTPEQMKKYAATYKDPHVLHIRKVINRYLGGKPEGDDNYEALKAVDREYLKNRFVILLIGDSVMGGKEISLLSQKRPDKIFKAWIYKAGGKYELRSFDGEEHTDEEIKKIKIMFRRYLQDKELAL